MYFAELYFSHVDINFSMEEIKSMIEVIDRFQFHSSKIRFSSLRKSIMGEVTREGPSQYNRRLWQFAIKGVIEKLKLGEQRFDQNALTVALQTLQPKLKYSRLFLRNLKAIVQNGSQQHQSEVQSLSTKDASELLSIEKTLQMKDIELMRRAALDKLLVSGYCNPSDLAKALIVVNPRQGAKLMKRYDLPETSYYQEGK
jgi:hypothetical protein